MIVSHVWRFLSSFPNFSVQCIQWQANGVAHSLTKTTSFDTSLQDFYHSPHCISSIIMKEMSWDFFVKKNNVMVSVIV